MLSSDVKCKNVQIFPNVRVKCSIPKVAWLMRVCVHLENEYLQNVA